MSLQTCALLGIGPEDGSPGTRISDARFERTPSGEINNCSEANGEPEKDCQICEGLGACPDRLAAMLLGIERLTLAEGKAAFVLRHAIEQGWVPRPEHEVVLAKLGIGVTRVGLLARRVVRPKTSLTAEECAEADALLAEEEALAARGEKLPAMKLAVINAAYEKGWRPPPVADPGSRDPGSAFVARFGVPLDAGEQVEVTLGAETYTLVKYQAFTVGPFTARVTVREGETAGQARDRALAFLRETSEVAFEEGLRRHLERVERAARETDAAVERVRGR